MNDELSPRRWANNLNTILNAVCQENRFPVDVKSLALDYSRQRFPDDPITDVLGGSLPGFEGALYPADEGKKGWGIIYNEDVRSSGRINFTLAHELGHYLIHRLKYPEGLQCGEKEMAAWDAEYRKVESEANQFAASLLMPLDDMRRQINARAKPDFDALSMCAERYDVSLMALILQWLEYTERRAILVVSRDGFILWARSSNPAYRSNAYFRTANRPPIEISGQSLAAQRHKVTGSKGSVDLDAGIWLQEPCQEVVLFSDQYDFTISLLHLGQHSGRFEMDDEPSEDTFDRMISRTPGSSWLG
jgi:hypothetical protein